ncbi:MAG: hypothetical protein WA755_09940 [Candidatus Acidiferrales bacterium]
MSESDRVARSVVVHTAGTATEAMVIRSLLESKGIQSPGSVSSDPFPLREAPEGMHGVEIIVLESHADAARKVIEDYLRSDESLDNDGSSSDTGGEA